MAAMDWRTMAFVTLQNRIGLKASPMLSSSLIDIVGTLGATLSTLCCLPQALKVLREKETRAISLPATAAFTLGVVLWLIYGLAIGDWPLIGSDAVTLALMSLILASKLRYG
jgi:MtN3 and saliva related transmembrane protein